MKYYALWHHCHFFGARGACAISEQPNTLIPLHLDNIKNQNSCWHNYVNNVKMKYRIKLFFLFLQPLFSNLLAYPLHL